MLPRRELSRAVLIGTSDFQQLPKLPAVGNNLVDLRSALTDDAVGILGWEQCVVVDSPDSPQSLHSRLRSAASAAQDLLLVYYAGHGIRFGDQEELYLTVRQSAGDSPLDTCVPFEWVRQAVVDSPARTKLIILDCCYSGMALGTMSAPVVDTRQLEVSGTTVITSAPRNSVSHSLPGARHTAFTGELITLLRSGSPLAEQPLTVSELFRSLLAAMARRDLPQPRMRSGDTSGSLQLRQFQPPEPVAVVMPEPEPVVVEPEPEPEPVVPEPELVPEPPVVWPQQEPDAIRIVATLPAPPANQASVRKVYRPLVGAICLLFAVNTALGCFIGAAFGSPPAGATGTSDLGMAIGATAASVFLGWIEYRRYSRGGRWLVLEDVAPVLAKRTTPIRLGGLAVLYVMLVIASCTALFGKRTPSSEPSSFSDLALNVATALCMIEGAIACGYSLVRRIRGRKATALNLPLPPGPPAHS